jgi:membrane fusion protein (multidrug efflux system)
MNGTVMLKRRAFWLVIALIVAIALLTAVAANSVARKAAPAQALPAADSVAVTEFLAGDVITVTAHELRQTLTFSGALRALNQAAVKAKVAGEVREVLVREGEAVTAGQILIRIDGSEFQARLAQARGAMLAARGQLDIATNARDNNQALLAKGFISKNAFDNAASQYVIAQANLASAKGALDVAQKALADTVIHAPISGLISSRSVQPGEKVSADNRLLDIVDLRQIEMEAAVPVTDIALVKLGQQASIKVDGVPDAVSGTVTRINPSTQAGSRSVMAYIQIDNPQRVLRMGMFGEARLTLAQKSGVLSVPQSAIQLAAGQSTVYAIENGKLLQKPVLLGIRGNAGEGRDEAVEIVQGLASGARIVQANLGNLRAGSAVKFAAPAQKD